MVSPWLAAEDPPGAPPKLHRQQAARARPQVLKKVARRLPLPKATRPQQGWHSSPRMTRAAALALRLELEPEARHAHSRQLSSGHRLPTNLTKLRGHSTASPKPCKSSQSVWEISKPADTTPPPTDAHRAALSRKASDHCGVFMKAIDDRHDEPKSFDDSELFSASLNSRINLLASY